MVSLPVKGAAIEVSVEKIEGSKKAELLTRNSHETIIKSLVMKILF